LTAISEYFAQDHVLHGFAAQMLCGGFPEHPAHSIDYVGFTATVRSNHTHQVSGDRNVGRINEGFETSELDVGEAQLIQTSL
jgi:hypothetical protein